MVSESGKPHRRSETGRSVGFGYDNAIPSNSVCYSGAQVPFGGPHCGWRWKFGVQEEKSLRRVIEVGSARCRLRLQKYLGCRSIGDGVDINGKRMYLHLVIWKFIKHTVAFFFCHLIHRLVVWIFFCSQLSTLYAQFENR